MDEVEAAIHRKGRVTEGLPMFAVARDKDPVTSHAAMDYINAKRGTLAATLLQVYLAYPDGLTDREAGWRSGIEGCWKRCADLRKLGLIVPTGAVRGTPSGMVCRAV